MLLNFMPTETYHEEAKGVSKVWYVYRERIPMKPGIRICQETFEVVRERIKRNGLEIHPIKLQPKKIETYSTKVYSVCGTNILINELLLNGAGCPCIKHAVPKSYLTISARNEADITNVAEKLSLPLRFPVTLEEMV